MHLKVCLYISAFPQGGAERQIVNLARELAGRGIHVVLLHAQKDLARAFYLERLEGSGVEIISALAPAFLQEGIRLSRKHADFYAHIPAPGTLKMGILHLAGALAHIRPDVVHSYLDIPNCTAGCAAVLAEVPHLASFRSLDPQTKGIGPTKPCPTSASFPPHGAKACAPSLADLTLPLYRYLLKTSSLHLEANSKSGAQHYARWLRIAPERIACTPNGLDPASGVTHPACPRPQMRDALGISATAPLVLTLARFCPDKSPAAMLDIFTRIHGARPEARHIIAGMGMTEQDEMGAMARERGLGPAVHLLGARSDVASLLGCADVFLLPSRVESFPNAVMEAMSAGVPVVASNVGGIPDLVRHGQDGFLHEPDDVAGMAESALALLDDAAMRARLGAAGRQRIAEEFTLQKLGDRVLRRYEALLADAARTRH